MPAIEDQPARTFHTTLGQMSTRDCPMDALKDGDRIVGPDSATVYEVQTPCAEHTHGWLVVRDLSITDDEAAALLVEPGAVEAGAGPRDGFFSYPPDTQMHRII